MKTETIAFRTTTHCREAILMEAERSNTTVSRVVAKIVEAHYGTAQAPKRPKSRAKTGSAA